MARHKRINLPGCIYHIITRGLERKPIFLDDQDRKEFLIRLEKALEQTDNQCFAWCLMPNHFHLLIRTGAGGLTRMMRKILSGYAIYFNHRHKRHGYLFQNRYKSILCQEEVYLLELVRYIHLNPVRAKLVSNLSELEKYPWCGHLVLTGKRKLSWQQTDEVLYHFHEQRKQALKKYRKYILDGWNTKRRDDLTGGGLRRSAGGWEGVRLLKQLKEGWRGDERILGDGDFVNNVLKEYDEEINKKTKFKRAGWSLDKLIHHISSILEVEVKDIISRSRIRKISMARAVIAYLGYEELKLNGAEIAKVLRISRPALSEAIIKGKQICHQNPKYLIS